MTDRPTALARMWSVTSAPETVPMMRRRIQNKLASWEIDLDGDLDYGVRLVVSELVTNAILHSETPVLSVSLVVSPDRDELFIAVEDGHADHPTLRPSGNDNLPENGRGLRIVSDTVSRWGVEPTDKGKRVWAVIPRPVQTGLGERVRGELRRRVRMAVPRPPVPPLLTAAG
ncbi:ATP-binding protein [Streptacidiphilus melanogenes]|uniref:ATP-binding protein n=1 Tax=Streptacidiphilus melanogenes TaxID=411235 RepID=UPI000694D6C0|nr:ATP-binding protein [Streptacidiphilus melanogenes]